MASVFINEFHYDNVGTDAGEFIELAGPAGVDLTGWSLVLYNGNGGAVYNTIDLSSLSIPDQDDGFGTVVIDFPTNGIQNGSPDGFALVDNTGSVVQFLSYEGSFTATNGPANGLTSTDIGVAEGSSTPVGQSLQLVDGVWTGPATASPGALNTDSTGGNDDPEFKFIHEVQGAGAASPLQGQTVTIEAIVVGEFLGSNGLNGFFVQEEDADADDSAATSEGLFIFQNGNSLSLSEGDRVRVTGVVSEFFELTQMAINSSADVLVMSSGNVLPTAATVNFPLLTAEALESYEGMRVTIPDTLFVTEYFNLDRFGEIRLASDGPGNLAGTDGRLEQYTQFNAPSVEGFADYQAQIATRQIVLDDGSNVQNPDTLLFGRDGQPLSATNTLRGGDTVENLTGVLSYGFGDYRIQTDEGVDFQPTNPRPATPEDVGGSLKVASFNVLNFFTTLDVSGNPGSGPNNLEPRGADSQAEFDRQLQKLVTTILEIDADVLGLTELENEFTDVNGDGQFAINTLVNALNAEAGAGTYAYVDPGTPFVDTSDAISVGAIYKTASVQVAPGTTVEVLTDADLPALGLGGTPVFDGPNTNRAPLAVTFEALSSGEQFTLAVNHFKSKGGNGSGDDADIGDGQGAYNGTRLRAAQALDAWLTTDPTGSGDADFLIVGDLNAYAQEDPITYLASRGYGNVIENPELSYSYLFDGQYGTLDYGLANQPLLAQVTGATEWHINADEPDALDYNLNFGRDPALFDGTVPYRTSDHDPVILGLDLFTPGEVIDGGNGQDSIQGTDGSDLLCGGNGQDVIYAGRGRDILHGGNGQDELYGEAGDDLLIGGNGNDLLDGGLGTDTAEYEGIQADYRFAAGVADSFTVQGPSIGTDTLISIEFLRFTGDNTLVATADLFV